MKKATTTAIFVTTSFYMGVALIGYAAFGDNAPGNLLTGFGFYNPYWLIDIANVFIMVHLVGAYQVWAASVALGFSMPSCKSCSYCAWCMATFECYFWMTVHQHCSMPV